MNEILHANIFFLIASIATVCFTIFLCIILYHVVKIVKIIRSILVRVEEGSEILAEDAAKIRSFFTNGGIISRLLSFFMDQAFNSTDMNDSRPRRRSRKRINREDE